METEKMYTTTELMEITGLTRAGVLKRARPFGYTKRCQYVLKRTCRSHYVREFSFTESQVKAMGCDHYIQKEVSTKNNVAKVSKEEMLERLKKEHPLVTDERCFDKNWWPDPVPSIFEED